MFRLSRAITHLNVPSGRRALLPSQRQLQHRLTPSIVQQASFASKKDDKADPPPPKPQIDYEAERKIGERKLEARPEQVSTKSTTTNELKTPVENTVGDAILQNELKHDMGVIKDTFSLDNVPRESKILGLAGTLPYWATSLSTLYLGWDLKQQLPSGNAFYDAIIIDHDTAQYLLSIVEPVQLGYGAVIISFLGAIHWGLEYAEKKPHPERTRFRYGMGLIAPVIAWPTLIMPVPYALTAQFMAFVGLYFADARATTRGWAPTWYGSYRFMLTAMVGLALFISLIGRQELGQGNTLTSEGLQARLEQTGRADHDTDWAKLEAEEKEKLRKEKAAAEKKAKKEAGKKEKEAGKKKQEAGEKEKKGEEAEKKGKEADEAKKGQADKKKDDGDEEDDDEGDDENEDSEKDGDDAKSEDKKDKKEKDDTKDDKKDAKKDDEEKNDDKAKKSDDKKDKKSSKK